jgi:hypothetical protein
MSELKPQFPSTIGNEHLFAVKVDLDEEYGDEWLFGRIAYVIGGKIVGDFHLSTSLRDVFLHMYRILWDAGKRSTSRFDNRPAAELFETVWSVLYGETTSEIEELAVEECWVKHRVTLPADVFAGVHVFQFDERAVSRVIWKNFAGVVESPLSEVVVPLGTIESVYSELNEILERLTKWEESIRVLRQSG